MPEADLKYRAALDSAGVQAGLQNIMGGVSAMKSRLMGTVAGIAAALGIGLSFKAFGDGIRHALDLGGELKDLSLQTGVAVDRLVILQQAFKDAGLGAGAVGGYMMRLSRAIGAAGADADGKGAKAFKKLGLNLQDVQRMSPDEQFEAVGKALAGLGSQSEKADIAMSIFGRSGAKVLSLFDGGDALGDAAEIVGKQAKILKENAALFDRVSDLLGSASTKIRGFFVGVAEPIAASLLPLLEAFKGLDFSGFGGQVGDVLSLLIEAFRSGKLTELLGAGLNAVAINFIGLLGTGIDALTEGFGSLMEDAARRTVKILTDSDFWKGAGSAVVLTGLAVAKGFTVAGGKIFGLGGQLVGAIQDGLGKSREETDAWLATMRDKIEGGKQGIDRAAHGEMRAGEDAFGKVAGFKSRDLSEVEFGALMTGKISKEELVKARGAEITLADSMRLAMQKTIETFQQFNVEVPPELADMVAELRKRQAESKAAAPKMKESGTPEGKGGAPAGMTGKKGGGIDSDRLSQIGLFVGNAGRAVNYQQRTADNTRAANLYLGQIYGTATQMLYAIEAGKGGFVFKS